MSEESNNEEKRIRRGSIGLSGRGVYEERMLEEKAFYRKRRENLGELIPPPIDLTTPTLSPSGRAINPDNGLLTGGANIPDDGIRGYTAQINVTSASQLMLPADRRRTFLFLQNNDSLGSCTISFGVTATLATGIKLGANGGGILLDNNVPTAAIYIIGSIANNSNVTLISG